MLTMPLTAARARLAEVVDHARVNHEPVYLTRRNRPVAAVVAADRLVELLAAEAELAGAGAGERNAALTPSEASRLREFEELAARAARHIKPGTAPLTDPAALYSERAARL
ncbi:MAG: type II toxin-antitoxin system Phd/YefM family antitoxin [Propionibacteriaceae bacterium]|jgi:prevent-host-death family protein|nr:type II toxin-antitoxin system Phd/YefM family antitoxin [Propionibacteriaceae bacterium]